jgi:two-component system, NarL family, sensor histidine kinase DevS
MGGQVAGVGPGLAVPIVVAQAVTGVLVAAVPAGGTLFPRSDLDLLRQFPDQAAVVLEYGRAQHALRERSVAEDRERIALDLQAHLIRELSWTAMSLQGAQPYATQPQVRERRQEAVDRLDGAIRRMREAILSLGSEGRAAHRSALPPGVRPAATWAAKFSLNKGRWALPPAAVTPQPEERCVMSRSARAA